MSKQKQQQQAETYGSITQKERYEEVLKTLCTESAASIPTASTNTQTGTRKATTKTISRPGQPNSTQLTELFKLNLYVLHNMVLYIDNHKSDTYYSAMKRAMDQMAHLMLHPIEEEEPIEEMDSERLEYKFVTNSDF
jgi:hypothetical protein